MSTSSKAFKRVPGLDDAQLGHEARAQANDHVDLKLWLRLLACSTQIEQQIRQRLRTQFGTTLARFDYLAQLERHPKGLRMNQVSSYLMVTGANVTGLTDQLVKEGLVQRADDPQDRRSWRVALTKQGREEFAAMASVHEQWLREMFADLSAPEKRAMYDQLGRLRMSLTQQSAAVTSPPRSTTPRRKPPP